MRSRQGRLLRKYAIVFGALVGGSLIAGSLVQLYFSFQESQAAVMRIAPLEAARAALRISEFVDRMQEQVTESLPTPGQGDLPCEERLASFLALHRRAPEVADVIFIDRSGREQVKVSRVALNETCMGTDRSSDPAFARTRSGTAYYAPVEFRQGSEPFFRIAVPEGADAGVTVATVNLRFILEPVSSIKVSSSGHAYVVDSLGRLIAHPDISLVLRFTDLSSQPQVQAALLAPDSTRESAMVARDSDGRSVLTAFEVLPSTGWAVFIEQSLDEALAPSGASLWRAGGILALGLAASLLASLLLSRRMVEPIEAIQGGASRIGEGALNQRIDIHTGDELEDLADEFNRMAARLHESYATLELKVEDRTRDLAVANAELENKSRQLELASTHKSEFLANMSHELRTPLIAIIGFSDVLLENGDLNAKQEAYIRDILSSGKHQLALINDILDLAKVEAGRLELDRSAFSLTATIVDALALVRERATRHRITLSQQLDPGLGVIDADQRKVKQVLVNLLSNAVKFTPDGGRVEVSARREDGVVIVDVADTGVGIATEDQVRIFEKFQQAGRQIESSREGTGLGLALAKRFIELHGGRIWLESGPGKGSTFSFALPVAIADPGSPKTSPRRDAQPN
jgi:signal transduction histidine kinase